MRKIRIEGGGMKAVHFLAFGCALYLVFFGFQVLSRLNDDSANDGVLLVRQDHTALVHLAKEEKGLEPRIPDSGTPLTRSVRVTPASYVLHLQQGAESGGRGIDQVASEAIAMGSIAWQETLLQLGKVGRNRALEEEKESLKRREACKQSIAKKGDELGKGKVMMMLPCGLRVGSSITVVGKPKRAHEEAPGIWVSQFMMELQGLSLKESALVDGRVEAEQEEDPPRVFHFNPRLKGDWSSKPVIELNTCYRMQWGAAQRCEGLPSSPEDDTVDGFPKCEKWLTDVNQDQKKSTSTWWLNRLIGRTKKTSIDWPYPFAEDKLFVLTLSAGLEGYHVNVDGTHVASFPYRTGFVLEDATGFSINGDIDVHTVVATSLPTTHSSFSPHRLLEMSDKWKAPALPEVSVDLFIGILSAGNHFSERMAVRKSWMQSQLIQSSKVVARFFVALNARKEVNIQLKKEAEFFGDMIIVPFIDNYDLVVLKTIAICKYGAQNLSAKYIMKCDDDNFVRVDAVMKEIDKLSSKGSLYIGNLNYYHKPLRTGKWAVTYEEWPEDDYPPYANGPGYIISSDIAKFIVSLYNNQALRLFKMEDVSMGMWVEQFNASTHVHYSHDWKFCQFGCIDGYYTAHYQSPRQMLCMWEKLLSGKVQCCNMR